MVALLKANVALTLCFRAILDNTQLKETRQRTELVELEYRCSIEHSPTGQLTRYKQAEQRPKY